MATFPARGVRAALVLLLLVSSPGLRTAEGCFCAPKGPCDAVGAADAVFVATVVDRIQENVGGQLQWTVPSLTVSKTLLGTVSASVTMLPVGRPDPERIAMARPGEVWTGSSSCDYGFVVGREYLIDLTVAPTISSRAFPEARQLTQQMPAAVGSSRSDETKRIRVLAPQLDRADYSLGEPFFFDVLVENTGPDAIEFPTLLDPFSVDRQMAGATMTTIYLSFKDEILGLRAVSPQLLYGAREVPGSLIAVPPHGRLRIRALGQWLLIGATSKSRPDQWPRSLQIQATVSIGGNGITPAFETSQEAAPIVLLKPNR